MFISPINTELERQFKVLSEKIEGEFHFSNLYRLLYATDASVYREIPLAVAYPKNTTDVRQIIEFAHISNISIIPRAAGTSLAGQVVGNGIVVDISKHMTKILELNTKEKWIKIQAGVVLDELNKYLEGYGLFFGPETSTSNRCMLGGMVGNNACGAHSLIYGSTRDHLISVDVILSDGSSCTLGPLTPEELESKKLSDSLEGKIYRHMTGTLSDTENQKNIRAEYPAPSVKRRNTGYAIDILLEQQPFNPDGPLFNLAKLIAGSEGTLAFITEIKLNLVDLPPKNKGLLCAHFSSVNESLKANLIALKHNPVSIELIDEIIINCTKENIEQQKNRFFIQGTPGAILIIEFTDSSKELIVQRSDALINDFKENNMGYHYPLLFDSDINKAWALRKAGLGLLSNVEGEAKPVAVIEDTSVDVNLLPDYIIDFQKLLEKHNLSCVYYAHAATGELHLRPVLNLKKESDVKLFRTILHETAILVKKYRGSLSGEHGDGRLRGEFIPLMIGEKNYTIIKEIKKVWDEKSIFNARKIVDTPSMNTSLRFDAGQNAKKIETIFDFSKNNGILGATELCNGSADCRRTAVIGGLMCPSYMATLNETDTTRARANILREFLTRSEKSNPFAHNEIYEVLDLCLSCKACKSECPSNVDMAKLKAEFLHHYYKEKGIPLRTRLIAFISTINKMGTLFPSLFNFFISNTFFSKYLKKILGFAPKRSIPLLYKTTLEKWALRHLSLLNKNAFQKTKVLLFNDEFTNYNDVEIGIKTLKLLSALGYRIEMAGNDLSGRTFLSKGLLKNAKRIANNNIAILKNKMQEDTVLLGIEPSAILGFRDEFIDLAKSENKSAIKKIASVAFMIDEFITKEAEAGHIDKSLFTNDTCKIYLHGHCHQKALASVLPTKKMLELPKNYEVIEIKSSCCGMAGSFGYEKEHYDVSMKVGELVLFPAVRNAEKNSLVCAPGTSCRHQIKDGTGIKALHPAEILYGALIDKG
ncbi:MAG: FAD-linked oxidase C-terminal domain-containing protein [Bacteroidales bacterium]|nr:FAD-linked oxidase C-terminal domain-containing protein [Bacteroidales bacterium]